LVGKFLSSEFLLCACWKTEDVGQVALKCYININLYDLCLVKGTKTAIPSQVRVFDMVNDDKISNET
jgi:hypothetical protein